MSRCIYFSLLFWNRMTQEIRNKTPKFREAFHFLLISQRKYKVKMRGYYWVQYIKIISKESHYTYQIWICCLPVWQTLPASQKCKEDFHMLFRSNNYGKYTGGFYIHYHSKASQVLRVSSFLKKTLKNLVFLQHSIWAQGTEVRMHLDWWKTICFTLQ